MKSDADERRLIEDYLPIESISEEASGEPRTKGHISTLHVWRARRPLVACRAAVYSALVPEWQFAPTNGSDPKRASLGRANAAKFVSGLCKYPGSRRIIEQAAGHIHEHFGRPPRVLDMFAGGGAIPLEAARLGCETHALDLNPVAYLIELCTVTFPQQFGPTLADEVEYWGRIVIDRTRANVSDVLARIPLPESHHRSSAQPDFGNQVDAAGASELSVVAYYWTRTVPCRNRQCEGTVPLYRQTWLRKKRSGYVALKPIPDRKERVVRFQVVESDAENGFDFDPGAGSAGSSATCPFCRTTLDGPYVRRYGNETGFGQQLMCVIALNPNGTGKLYLVDESLAHGEEDRQAVAAVKGGELERELGVTGLDQEIQPTGNAGLATGKSYLYGIRTFRQAFTPRQRFILLSMAREIRRAHKEMVSRGIESDRTIAITTYLGIWLSRMTDRVNTLCRWNSAREVIQGLTDMKRFAMMWDFPEVNIFGSASGNALGNLEYIAAVIRREGEFRNPVHVYRGSATELPHEDSYFDAVITDPPYYDNESYSELSDVCFVWLGPAIGFLYPEHFATALTPKKKECVAAAYRQGGREAAKKFYEDSMLRSLEEAHRVTRPGGVLVIVYAHKTTLGWSTLVDALRRSGYMVTEAWPVDTETKARVAHHGDAALRSSIFLVARRRATPAGTGTYEAHVRPDLQRIVQERVTTLWDQGVSGADLVIAAVGAGLHAFTKYDQVEYENGESVPAATFLAEVEGVVLDAMLNQIAGKVARGVTAVDPHSRFYVLWRYVYKADEVDAGEAIVFGYGQHVELDGQNSLSAARNPLLEKKRDTYHLRDFRERGEDEMLGVPDGSEAGRAAPLIDALHRVLWIMENRPRMMTDFLRQSSVNRDQLRVLAQALSGPALKGGELDDVSVGSELAALTKLTSNWKGVIENAISPLERGVR